MEELEMGNEVGQVTTVYTKYGKPVACKVVARTEDTITVREGFDGSGNEWAFPVSALRKLNPNANMEIIDAYGKAK
jgi:hypothetical protein